MKKECFIYGITIPYEIVKKWKDNIDNDIIVEISKNNIEFYDYEGRDGKYVIIGKKINNDSNYSLLKEVITVPELTQRQMLKIKFIINKYFSLLYNNNEFHYYYVTNFI